jgi:predicted amidohydrolase YtcJ
MHQIAHLQLVDAADIGRFRPLRVAANIQGLWAQRDPESVALVEPIVGADRFNRSYPYGRLARAGALSVGGSDWSVTSMNPLVAIQVAVTGRAPTAASGSPWQPDNLVSLDAMLKAYTIHGARVQLHEREVGSIAVGKAADLVVLDRDLTEISPIDIHRAQVRYTFVDGRQVYPASP